MMNKSAIFLFENNEETYLRVDSFDTPISQVWEVYVGCAGQHANKIGEHVDWVEVTILLNNGGSINTCLTKDNWEKHVHAFLNQNKSIYREPSSYNNNCPVYSEMELFDTFMTSLTWHVPRVMELRRIYKRASDYSFKRRSQFAAQVGE